MLTLSQLIPLNLEEEKAKFLAAAGDYNPQFVYESEILESDLVQHGFPKAEYLKLAQKIVEVGMAGQTEEELSLRNGRVLSQTEVESKVKTFLTMHHLENRYKISWSSSFVARTAINADTIKIKTPVTFREDSILGALYHEIGTHALRRINYEQQPWFKRKKKFGFADYLRTEEGLAILHSLMPAHHQFAHSSALRYLAVEQAQHLSFKDLYRFLHQFIGSPEKCWRATFRRKMGLTDTSLPGGHTKDLVYFEGMVQVWRYLKDHNFDIEPLYFGKMSYLDVKKAQELNPDFVPALPSFFTLDKAAYREKMLEIGRINFL